MVFKLVKAGRKLHEIKRAVEEENYIHSYIEKREKRRGEHPLKEDLEILNKYVEMLRFSRPASLYFEPPGKENEEPLVNIRAGGVTRLPIARVGDILTSSDRWADRHVIIEGGELDFFSRNKQGEHWHTLSDGTGRIVAVSTGAIGDGKGTLFGVARRTSVGKQLFIEIKNFHQEV
jgi:hypothetical protein